MWEFLKDIDLFFEFTLYIMTRLIRIKIYFKVLLLNPKSRATVVIDGLSN